MYRKSYEYDAVVVDECVVVCVECAEEKGIDLEKAQPIFLDSEWENYPVCDKCGAVIEDINFIPATVDEEE